MKILIFIVMSIVCNFIGALFGYEGVYIALLLLILIDNYDKN